MLIDENRGKQTMDDREKIEDTEICNEIEVNSLRCIIY